MTVCCLVTNETRAAGDLTLDAVKETIPVAASQYILLDSESAVQNGFPKCDS